MGILYPTDELPVLALIRNAHGVAKWNLFLNE
jgi:hypothetical protein